MESRKITVVSSSTSGKKTIMSSATTLGELKRDFDAAGISYTNMKFMEATTKTELLNDDSQLPQNVMFKGQQTNNLVFMLTNTEKKIKSGIGKERQKAYNLIKSLGLKDKVDEVYGKNFTQCSTGDLMTLANNEMVQQSSTTAEVATTAPKKASKETSTKPKQCCGGDTQVTEVVKYLATTLYECGYLDTDHITMINSIMSGEPIPQPLTSDYSDSELREMCQGL